MQPEQQKISLDDLLMQANTHAEPDDTELQPVAQILADGEVENLPVTLATLINWADKKYHDLDFREQLLVLRQRDYESIKNRRIRMMVYRLYVLLSVGVTVTPLLDLETKRIPESFFADGHYGGLVIGLLFFLLIWSGVEDTIPGHYGEEFFPEAIIPDFGTMTREAKNRLEEELEANDVDRALDYSFAGANKYIRRQASAMYRTTYGRGRPQAKKTDDAKNDNQSELDS